MASVFQSGAIRTIQYEHGGKLKSGPEVKGRSQYSFSLDGCSFTEFGEPYQLSWGNYRGDRIGLYSYNEREDAGYVDIDYFHYAYR